jgi:hypothetical protein
MHTKIWLIEQSAKIGEHHTTIRGAARAKTRRKARERAGEAIRQATAQIDPQGIAELRGKPYVLYPITYE